MRSAQIVLILTLLVLTISVPLLPGVRAQETAQDCDPIVEPPSVAPPTGGAYRGPLFDTHLHLSVMRRFGSAPALCTWLERRQVLWAIGFLPVAIGRDSGTLTPVLSGAPRVIFLLRPTNAGSFADFAQGRYTADVFAAFLLPQGVFRGAGEVSLHQPADADALSRSQRNARYDHDPSARRWRAGDQPDRP